MKRGLYSAKSAEVSGTATWRSIDGREVEVTDVVEIDKDWRAEERWPDTKDVGLVTHWVSTSAKRICR